MKLTVTFRYIGLALMLNGMFMFLSALVALFNGPDNSFAPLLASGLIAAVTGLIPYRLVKPSPHITGKEGYFIVIFAWLACCLSGMLPYIFWDWNFGIVNAFFESTSGYTTTGATILPNVEALPKGLIFFRSCTAWMGGVGVAVFLLLFLPTMKNLRLRLANVELSNLSKDNFKYRIQQTVRIIGGMYVGLTLVEIILLWIAGMELFDAVNHAFSNVATCGFSTKNLSIQYFDNVAIETIITVFMYLSGLHFGLMFLLVSGRPKPFFRSPVIRFYTLTLLVGIVLIAANLTMSQQAPGWWTALRQSAFQVISIASTTGFATTDTSLWPSFSILVLVYFIFQCACSGSTAGGIKADRVLILYKSIKAQVKKMQHPNAIIPIRIGNSLVEPDTASAVSIFVLLYFIFVFAGTLLLSLMGIEGFSGFSASAACMSNVGPGFDLAGAMANYAAFPFPAKLLLAFQMLLGRLEIFCFILVFFSRGWK